MNQLRGFLSSYFLSSHRTYVNPWIHSMGIFTLGEILNYPAANMLIDKLAPEHMRGTYFGAQTLTNVGHFMGPWVGGFLLVSYGGNTLYIIMAVLTITGSLFYWKSANRQILVKNTSKKENL